MKILEKIAESAKTIVKGESPVVTGISAVLGPTAVGIGMYSDLQWLRIAGLFISAYPTGIILRPLADNVSYPVENVSQERKREVNPLHYI
jgi:hypothetical protein